MILYYPQNCSQWCRNSDVSHLISQRWDGPHQPTTPMEKLVSMGFADRALNTSLLEKHSDNLQAVLEELLDRHN